MKWFKHISESGDDPDIGAILDKFGYKGYYMFFRTIEVMSKEFDIDNPGVNIFNFSWFLGRFPRNIDKKILIKFLNFTNNIKRIMYILDGKDIHLKCLKLKELTDNYTTQVIKETSKSLRSNFELTSKLRSKKKEVRSKKEDKNKNKPLAPDDKKYHPKPPKINFNFETSEWENIKPEDFKIWVEAYPACNVASELKIMGSWLLSNPSKKKSQYKRFINNWLSRTQDKGGTRGIPDEETWADRSERKERKNK